MLINILVSILQLLFPILVIIIPFKLYKSDKPYMTGFYIAMLRSANARKFYIRILLIILLAFHGIYSFDHCYEWGMVFSTVLCGMVYSYHRTDRCLHILHENRKCFFWTAFAAVAIAMVPHLYTTGMTIAILLLASMFYPSYHALSTWKDEDTREYWTTYPEILSGYYY